MSATNKIWHQATITRAHRNDRNRHKSLLVWFTGFSGAGKSTLAHAVEEMLHHLGYRTFVLDGDNIRHGLNGDLGFDQKSRHENMRRIGEVGKLFVEAGLITLCAFISPFRTDREYVRSMLPHGDFLEVYVKCPIEVCEKRDVKGFYRRARRGEIADFTGISAPYEAPENPDLTVDTDRQTLAQSVENVMALLKSRDILKPSDD